MSRIIYSLIALTFAFLTVSAQETTGDSGNQGIVIDQLFEYCTAPDELVSLEERSDYIMKHFWDNMNFKSGKAVDQYALTHAFSVYSSAMPYASREAVEQSTKELIKKLQKNPALLLQFTKAAEENLYGNRAQFWVDEIYIPFLQALVNAKKIDKVRKIKYERQLKLLSNSQPGTIAPNFTFTKPDGTPGRYFPMRTPTLIEFGSPTCHECRMARLKLESNVALQNAVNNGQVSILFIIPEEEDDWQNKVSSYNSKWAVGSSDDVADIYDIRLSPTFYVIGNDGKIIAKNITADNAVSLLMDQIEKKTE